MSKIEEMGYIVETKKRIPIAYDVDVVVAGGGISGLFAALAAGRMGAKTVLIERLSSLGGNIGPGFLVGGSHLKGLKDALPKGLTSLPEEFFNRLDQLRATPDDNYADTSNIVSYLGVKMADEAGVELILSAYASDPIIEDKKVKGIFIEGKSGRVAVRAKIVIDATGDANIAERAGAFIIKNVSEDYKSFGNLTKNEKTEFKAWNETGLYFFIGNADLNKYNEFINNVKDITDDDKAWADNHLKGRNVPRILFPNALIPILRKAWESGEYKAVVKLENPDLDMSFCPNTFFDYGNGVIGSRAGEVAGEIDMSNMKHISLLEAKLRTRAFETVQFFKANVPGFEEAYVMFIAPFFGARGGPCIDGEHTITTDEAATGVKFNDVLFKNYFRRAKIRKDWVENGYDIPYRALLPKNIHNMLVTGRGAAYIRRGHDGAGMRIRVCMMALGHAAGIAAALCINEKTSPIRLDIRNLQKKLIEQGFYLGDSERLTELGIIIKGKV